MAKKVTRKELLKKPDEFLTFSQRMMAQLIVHKGKVIGGICLIFAVIIGISGVRYFSNKAESQAFEMMHKVLSRYQETVEKDDPQKALEAVDAEFQTLLAEYPAKTGGKMARVAYANIVYAAGNYAKAMELYTRALSDFGDMPDIRNQILSGLGYACESKGDIQAALDYFDQIASGTNPVMKEEAIFNLGRLYAKNQAAEKSKEAFKRLITDFPDSIYAEMVREKLPAAKPAPKS